MEKGTINGLDSATCMSTTLDRDTGSCMTLKESTEREHGDVCPCVLYLLSWPPQSVGCRHKHPLGVPLSLDLVPSLGRTCLEIISTNTTENLFFFLCSSLQLFILHASVLALTSSPALFCLLCSLVLSALSHSRLSSIPFHSLLQLLLPHAALSVSTRTSSLPKVWYLGSYILLCFRLIIPCTPFNWSCCFFLSFLSSLLTPPTVENAHPSPFFAPPLILLSALCLFPLL